MELLGEHTHFPGLSFISQCVYVCVHVAWQRNLTASLPSLVPSALAKSTHTYSDHTHRPCFLYRQLACVCVCVRVLWVTLVIFDDKTHSTCCSHLWSHPSYRFDITVQSPQGRWHQDLHSYVCIRTCIFVRTPAFQHSEENIDLQVVGLRQA